MRQYDPKKSLISIHIPKCAGTSFYKVLRRWFCLKLKTHYVDTKKNSLPRPHKLKPGQCIHGHFNKHRDFGISDYYPEVEQFITIVRDPFDIAISDYFFGRKLIGTDKERQNNNISSPDISVNLASHMKQNNKSFMLYHFPDGITLDNYKDFIEEKFVYIGIAEDLQCSVDILASRLGFKSVKVPILNISQREVDIPDSFKDTFIKENPLEYAIYNYALERYKV